MRYFIYIEFSLNLAQSQNFWSIHLEMAQEKLKRLGTLEQASVDLLFLRLFKRFLKLGLGVGLGLGLGIVLGLGLGTRLDLGLRVSWVLCIATQSYSNLIRSGGGF